MIRESNKKSNLSNSTSKMDAAKDAFEAIQRFVRHLVVVLQKLKWEDVPQKAKEHIKNNPKMSAFQALSMLLLSVPGLVVGPVLAAMGFGSAGPLAGKVRFHRTLNMALLTY